MVAVSLADSVVVVLALVDVLVGMSGVMVSAAALVVAVVAVSLVYSLVVAAASVEAPVAVLVLVASGVLLAMVSEAASAALPEGHAGNPADPVKGAIHPWQQR